MNLYQEEEEIWKHQLKPIPRCVVNFYSRVAIRPNLISIMIVFI